MINTVLVIDDDPQMRTLIASILEEAGYSVETAGDGKQAIKVCKKFPIDVALIDIELPDVKGTKLLGELKDIQPKMIKIILTGHPSIENAVTAVNEKADGYVLKPFQPIELLKTIERLLSEKKNEYLTMLKDVEKGKSSTPISRYQHPDRW